MNDANLRSYLLNELSETEQLQVEDRLFTEEGFLDQIAVTEDELIDAYVRNELSGHERQRFEKHFLTSPRVENRVRVAASLFEKISVVKAKEPRPSRAESFLGLIGFSGWRLQAAASIGGLALVAALALVVVTNVWHKGPFATHNAERSLTDTRGNARNQSTGASADANGGTGSPLAMLSVVLQPGTVRSVGQETRLRFPAGSYPIRFKLKMRSNDRFPSYRVVITDTEGNQLWSDEIPNDPGGGDSAIAVNVPSNVFRAGTYTLSISGVPRAAGPLTGLEDYAFTVVRE